jgi:hypothetical protein
VDDVARRTTLRLVAGLAAGVALLGGCSEKQEASDTLPSAGATEPSEAELPPLGPADLPMPDEARTQDAAGAEAFVRYYIDLINRTSTVMDAAPLREFSDGCIDCARIATSTENAAAAGQRYEGGEMTIVEVGRPLMKETIAEMPLRVNQAQFVVRASDGTAIEGGSEAYSNILGGAALRWNASQDSWLMTDLTFG